MRRPPRDRSRGAFGFLYVGFYKVNRRTLDPIFSGLAWAIIFGIFTATVFSLLVVPVVYWLLFSRNLSE